MERITINGIEYQRASTEGFRYCIVRCRDAGVHAGYVAERNGREVKLLKSRRLWRWHGRTLSGLAIEGTTDIGACKYAPEVPEIEVLDACEIIPCTEAGQKSIEQVPEWTNN
jgi:hypothetical protein